MCVVCLCAFDFLHDTRATIHSVNTALGTCAQFSLVCILYSLKTFFLYLCLCLSLSRIFFTIFSICSYTFRSFPFFPQPPSLPISNTVSIWIYINVCVCESECCFTPFHSIPHHSTSLSPFHLCVCWHQNALVCAGIIKLRTLCLRS